MGSAGGCRGDTMRLAARGSALPRRLVPEVDAALRPRRTLVLIQLAFARLEDPIGRKFRSARKSRVSACPMTIERQIFGWKFDAAGAAGDLAPSCSILRAARPKTQWTRRLNGPECAG